MSILKFSELDDHRPDVLKRLTEQNLEPIKYYLTNAIYAITKKPPHMNYEVIEEKDAFQILQARVEELENEKRDLELQLRSLLRNDEEENRFPGEREIMISRTRDSIDALERKKGFLEREAGQRGVWLVLEEDDENPISDDIASQFFSTKTKLYMKEEGNMIFLRVEFVFEEESILRVSPKNISKEEIRRRGKLYLSPRTTTLERQKRAIEDLILSPQKELRGLYRLFESLQYVKWPEIKNEEVKEWYILTEENRPGIIEQREFIKKALGTPDFAILEGPPGSGKTTTILELILQLIKRNKRILLCASTHVAVDNVLERLRNMVDVNPIRVGRIIEKVDEKVLAFTVDKFANSQIARIREGILELKRANKASDIHEEMLVMLGEELDANSNDTNNNHFEEKILSSPIFRLIVQSINLVCGTTLGFLAHKNIFNYFANDSIGPPFDVMILDEASKTPFTEFLVPAIHAKKWILVGDRRQLSPFLDDRYLAAYIHDLIEGVLKSKSKKNNSERAIIQYIKENKARLTFQKDSEILDQILEGLHLAANVIIRSRKLTPPARLGNKRDMRLARRAYEARILLVSSRQQEGSRKDQYPWPYSPIAAFIFTVQVVLSKKHVLILDNELYELVLDFLSLIAESSEFSELQDDWKEFIHSIEFDSELLPTLWNDYIVGTSKQIYKIKEKLPTSFSFIPKKAIYRLTEEGSEEIIEKWGWHEKKLENTYREEIEGGWSEQIAWRVSRRFELRDVKETNKRYQEYLEEIEMAMPKFLEKKAIDRILQELSYLETFVLPSIIELLQRGYEGRAAQRMENSLTRGLPKEALGQRHETLQYQHRMHPDISQFPREEIYRGISALKDPENIIDLRSNYRPGTTQRITWIDVRVPGRRGKSDKVNEAEAKAAIREINDFIKWALDNPHPYNDYWEVAVLTFYRAQEHLLKYKLAKKLRTVAKRYQTISKGEKPRVRIEICTVDRFQGKEADLVILSLVRNRSVGFLDSPNRLNVALTRARYQLIIIGNHDFIKKQKRSPLLRRMAEFYEKQELIQKPLE